MGTVKFNGNLLDISVFVGDKGEDVFSFFIDSESCTISFMELEKTEQTKKLPDTFTPKILYEFFSQLGAEFITEIYDEETGVCSISRNVGNFNVCLDVFQESEQLCYTIKIN